MGSAKIMFGNGYETETEVAVKKIKKMLDIEVAKSTMTAHSEEEIKTAIANGDALTAFIEDVVVGYVELIHWKDYLEISALIVDEKYRRCGIGSALIEEAVKLAKTKHSEKELIALTNVISTEIICKHGFVQKKKDWFSDEIWELCSGCQEEKIFPDCHCVPLVYENSVAIVKISGTDEQLIGEMAQLYCEIWKEPPWNEDFWKVEEVSREIHAHLLCPHAIVMAALEKGKIIGFSWGKSVNKQELKVISSEANLDCVFKDEAQVFYVNELAVNKKARNRNVGSMLAQCLVNKANKSGFRKICLRTDQKAVAAQRVYLKIGFCDLAIKDGRHSQRTYWLLV